MTVRPKSRQLPSSGIGVGPPPAKRSKPPKVRRADVLTPPLARSVVDGGVAAGQTLPVAQQSANQLLGEVMSLDLNRDGQLDARDERLAKEKNVVFAVEVRLRDGRVEPLATPERLAHAADVLATAVRVQGPKAVVPEAALLEPAGEALQRAISDAWPALVRRSNDVPSLVASLKVANLPAPDGKLHVWVPASDPQALARLKAEATAYNEQQPPPDAPLEVEVFSPGTDWRALDAQRPGVLYLPHEFVVPGGRFTEMYGWDSHFIAQGLLGSGRTDLARAMLQNQVYMVEHYGKIPNSSRSYHLSRSQPPFMPRLALELYAAEPTLQNLALLREVAAAGEKELAHVWRAPGQLTPSGLSRFHDDASGPDLEVERNLTSQGVYAWPDPEADRAARATGWDLSHRFGDHAQDFEPVDLNSELYRYEKDLAEIYRLTEGPYSTRAAEHDASAAQRAAVMQQRLWSVELGMFVDYDLRAGEQSTYETLATFGPLAAGWATPEQAAQVAANLPAFLERGGLATSSRRSRETAGEEALQWDWPNGWAPLQVIAVEGLTRYGFAAEANEVAYRWLYALLEIAGANNGLLPEKVDVHAVTADVAAAEYGNQGADRGSYWMPREASPQGFGWTNASFIRLRAGLPPALAAALDRGVSPTELFGRL